MGIRIKSIKLRNFRSFRELDLPLSNFNVIVGANASGKSNFISVFSFLKNLIESGIDDAISLLGGIEYLRNIYLHDINNITVEIEIEASEEALIGTFPLKENFGISPKEMFYRLEISAVENQGEYIINEEVVRIYFNIFNLKEGGKIKKNEGTKNAEITITRKDGTLTFESSNLDDIFKQQFLLDGSRFSDLEISQTRSILNAGISSPLIFIIFNQILNGIRLYEINPKPPKEFSRISGKSELERDGKNLILILKRILGDKKKEEKLTELIKDFLPFIDKISIDKLADKYISANIKEVFSSRKSLPASLMSDGTINIIALIIILFFEDNPIVIIEEPEGNIHPYLISKVVEMMKDVANRYNKQIIITTHNPEIVKFAGIENLYLMKRDKNGFSTVSKAQKSEQTQIFLQNDMGLDELFIQKLLE